MSSALLIFAAVGTSLAMAGILTAILQFFADGWKLPTKERLAEISSEERKQRKNQIPIVFIVCFFIALSTLAVGWHLGGLP